MSFIKNYSYLARTPERKIVLGLVEEALKSIQPEVAFKEKVKRSRNILSINDNDFDLNDYENIYILGFGKGSSGNAKLLEDLIQDRLTDGWVIDTQDVQHFKKIKYTKGTHPLPSEINFNFTQKVIGELSNLTSKDLVLIVVCGGGSAMLVHPHSISLEQKINVGKALLKSGANISEMNIVRKHLSDVKGGGLAQIIYPATAVTLIFSDVPGNDLSTIASGPTVEDKSSIADALHVIKKYGLEKELKLPKEAFVEKPHDSKYFKNICNLIVLSNDTALDAMKRKARSLGIKVQILSDRFEMDANLAGKKLISHTPHNTILLAGGETTVKVSKKGGRGGRNQELVLASLPYVKTDVTICSFATDGWDNTSNAGAIGDIKTNEKCQSLRIDPDKYLEKNASFDFFDRIGDALITGRLPSNVSDLMIVFRK